MRGEECSLDHLMGECSEHIMAIGICEEDRVVTNVSIVVESSRLF
jgi:hypothetical protein